MKVYKITDYRDIVQEEDTVLVLGYFDGLHLGHQSLFQEAQKLAKHLGLKVAVLTFPESPKLAFSRFEPELLLHLNSPEDRLAKFAEAGVDFLYWIDFTGEFAQNSSSEFIQNYVKTLRAQALVAGFDYRFGSDQKDAHYLKEVLDCPVHIVAEQQWQGQKISSTQIRQAILAGNVTQARELLGYTYNTRGLVVHGDARGRTIGYPTANLAPLDRVFLPGDGVYVADVEIKGKLYRSMASVGKNVTFDGQELRIEAHILDFEGDLYGQTIQIHWLDKLREMVKFDGIDSLTRQLADDEEKVRVWKA
ncbi:bifunctional riboflavin kinase/FAD synthetase [Streptococcus ovuberis]|uniref:Riboflavin biosynthesis protein n=1 Tax=Streptococcus ovuberis TaxID=1936207 RepID=A0A7X6MYT9_9STRE|nr:bifunctional riboflavin kinase/FAD synthetase [Streptococcus ovuberis]NKZ20273.1 bifunctional riboflavin kinase/FAD synthetase [Streptococcus ovuberis]